MMSEIELLRRFNRTVTRRIGVLSDDFLGRKRPLGASRLLFEIGSEGCEVRELRQRLGLDSGYASRLLRALEREGLVETVFAFDDARVRIARLTDAGLRELAELDRLSDVSAQSILDVLGGQHRARLVSAMAEVERLLRVSDLSIASEQPDGETAQWCLAQYYALLNERFEGGYDPGDAAPADADEFMPPEGVFLVARTLGEPVGCGALRKTDAETAEIKRLWVAEDARGLGLGKRLLATLEAWAIDCGYSRVRLDSNKALTEALALYRKNGYAEVPRFNDDPYPHFWFEKKLGGR